MKLIFITSLLLFANVVSAGTDLTEVDQFLSADTFTSAFRAGDQVHFTSKSCLSVNRCDENIYMYHIESASESSATLATQTLAGEVFSRSSLSAETWNQNFYNRVRMKIQLMVSYGFQITIESIVSSSRSVLVAGQTQTVATKVVKFTGANQLGMKSKVLMEVAPNLGWGGQVLRQTEDKGLGFDSLEVKEVFRK